MSVSLSQRRTPSLNWVETPARKIAIMLAFVSAIPSPVLASDAASVPTRGKVAASKSSAVKSDLFFEQARQLRANTCAGLYAALGNSAVEGSTYTLRTEADSGAPEARPLQGTVGMAYKLPDVKGQAAALVSAARVGDKCEGQFVRIVPFQVNCSQVLRDFPAGSKPISNLSGVPLYQLGGNGGQALTIPTGETCIVVSIVRGQQRL
jgi:hypothetical protein